MESKSDKTSMRGRLEDITEQDLTPKQIARLNLFKATDQAFQGNQSYYLYHANLNHQRWKTEQGENSNTSGRAVVTVEEGDWGDTTLKLSRQYGKIFAVLNMANPACPWLGDGLNGTQEEDIANRTNLRRAMAEELKTDAPEAQAYPQEMSDLINAKTTKDGHPIVYLDKANPRICIKGSALEKFRNLDEMEYFLFYELRAAADTVGWGKPGTNTRYDHKAEFDEASMRRKIRAQLHTLIQNDIRHVVLGAFGCGAFCNPAEEVARIYREELLQVMDKFDVVVFAVFDPKKENNYAVFNKALHNLHLKGEQGLTEATDQNVSKPTPETKKADTTFSCSICLQIICGIAAVGGALALIFAFGVYDLGSEILKLNDLSQITDLSPTSLALAIGGGISFFGGIVGGCCLARGDSPQHSPG